MSQQPFQKFINPKNNAAIKEKYKQEKKTAKKQKAAAIEKHFEEKRALRYRGFSKNMLPEKEQQLKSQKRQKYPQEKKDKPLETRIPKKDTGISEMPLNKFLAHCGVTSRRDAVALIIAGKVLVNKNIITQPAFKVNEKDDVVL